MARATIGLYRLNMRQFGLRRLIISAARACGAQLIGFFHSNMRHLGLRRLIISAARATGAHTIGFFRIDMRHFGMVARIVVRANHTNSATFDGRNNYRSKRRPNGCALAASESVSHSVIEITMVPHLGWKIAPISLVSCTRVLGLGFFPATARR